MPAAGARLRAGRPRCRLVTLTLCGNRDRPSFLPGLFFQNEGHLHCDSEFVDLAVPHARFLLDHMKASNAT